MLASPSTAYLDYGRKGPTPASTPDLERPHPPGRRQHRRLRRPTATCPDTLDAGPATTPASSATTPTSASRSPPARRAPTSSACSPPASTIPTTRTNTNDLVPRRSVEGQALWTLAVTPVFSTALFGSYYYYNADDDIDETSSTSPRARPAWSTSPTRCCSSAAASAMPTATARRRPRPPASGSRPRTTPGLTARGDFRYALPGRAASPATRAGPPRRRTPRLSGSAARPSTPCPAARSTAGSSRTTPAASGGDEERVTGAGIGLTRDLNTVSRVGLDFAYAVQVNQDDPDEPGHRPHRPHLELHLRLHRDGQRRARLPLPPPHRGPGGRRPATGLPRDRPELRDRALGGALVPPAFTPGRGRRSTAGRDRR